MLIRFIVVVTILSPPAMSQTTAQQPAVTLAEAIRRSERVQPVLVRAADDVRAGSPTPECPWSLPSGGRVEISPHSERGGQRRRRPRLQPGVPIRLLALPHACREHR